MSRLVIIVLTILVGPVLSWTYVIIRDEPELNITRLVDELHWKEVESPIQLVPDYPKGDITYIQKLENLFGNRVTLYLNYFLHQEQGREAINNLNSLIDSKKGSVISKGIVNNISITSVEKLSINEQVIVLKNNYRYVAWQWYFTNGKHSASTMETRINNLIGLLINKPAISNIVLLAKIRTKEADAREKLKLFVQDNYKALINNL